MRPGGRRWRRRPPGACSPLGSQHSPFYSLSRQRARQKPPHFLSAEIAACSARAPLVISLSFWEDRHRLDAGSPGVSSISRKPQRAPRASPVVRGSTTQLRRSWVRTPNTWQRVPQSSPGLRVSRTPVLGDCDGTASPGAPPQSLERSRRARRGSPPQPGNPATPGRRRGTKHPQRSTRSEHGIAPSSRWPRCLTPRRAGASSAPPAAGSAAGRPGRRTCCHACAGREPARGRSALRT